MDMYIAAPRDPGPHSPTDDRIVRGKSPAEYTSLLTTPPWIRIGYTKSGLNVKTKTGPASVFEQ